MGEETKGVVRVGIAGLGRSGWDIHARLLEPLKDKYRIVAVCDPDQSRQKEARDRFRCRSYDGLNQLLKDFEVELVIVAIPSHLHPPNAIQALKAGKDVVCEKPMAIKLSDADRVIKAAKKSGHIFTIFQNRRYAPDFVKVREVIISGKLGRIVMIRMTGHGFSRRWDWQTLKEFSGGTLNNTGPHFIDQALQLFGEAEPKIFCHLERTLTCGDADDHIKIILQGPDAPMIDLEITSACAYPQESWLVMGTQGGLTGGSQSLRWKYFDPQELLPRKVERQPVPDRSYNTEEIPWKEEMWDLSTDSSPGETGFYLDLYNTIRNRVPLAITPESVRRQIALIDKCHKLCPVYEEKNNEEVYMSL